MNLNPSRFFYVKGPNVNEVSVLPLVSQTNGSIVSSQVSLVCSGVYTFVSPLKCRGKCVSQGEVHDPPELLLGPHPAHVQGRDNILSTSRRLCRKYDPKQDGDGLPTPRVRRRKNVYVFDSVSLYFTERVLVR